MGKLIYSMNVSLDGYVETLDHSLDWTTIDDEIHGWWNEQIADRDAFLYGRRIYELMAGHWPTAASDPATTPVMLEFARVWNATPKIVFSNSPTSVVGNTRVVSGDVADELAKLRDEFPGNLDVAGPTLASAFIERGLVDEFRPVVHPVALGAGTPFIPKLERPLRLRLTETRTFESGAVFLGYVKA
jgi:dihydrofolate reductase